MIINELESSLKSKQQVKLCANLSSQGITVIAPFPEKAVMEINCKDCVYFSSKNCGSHHGNFLWRG